MSGIVDGSHGVRRRHRGLRTGQREQDCPLTAGSRRILGRPDQHELSLEEAVELFHPGDRRDVQQALDRAFETGEETHGTWLQPEDSEERLLEVDVIPAAESGPTRKLRGTGHDITDRRKRQRKLEQTRDLMTNTEQLTDTGA